jgi:hypothetical protein
VTAAIDPWAVIEAVFPKPEPAAPPRTPAVYAAVGAGSAYAQAALEQEAQRVVDAPEGTRNHTLNRAAFSLGQLVAGGALAEDDVVHTLRLAAEQAGLEGVETLRTIASGLRGGASAPRGVPETPPVEDWLAGLPTATAAATEVGGITYDPATGEVLDIASPERGSWWPRDLGPILSGELTEEPPPAFLARSDGQRLFYAGKVNALIGESESGKTWVGLLTALQALQEGQRVLYLDFEDTAPGIVARLRLLGATDAHLSRLAYIGPDESLDAVHSKRDLRDHLAEHPPALIIFDGVNAAMTLLGLDLEKNKDATQFSLQLLRPLKRTGAAVVTIDHVTKSKDNRGSYAIGAQAKRADIDGCALLVEVVQPFGRGMRGKLKLTVSKDRPGQVRAISGGAKAAGLAYIDSTAGDSTNCWVEAPDLRPEGERPAWRPTVLMERISAFLQTLSEGSEGVSGRAIVDGVTGNAKHLRAGLQMLVDDRYVERTTTPSGAMLHRSLRPYLAHLDPLSDQGASMRPRCVLGASEDAGPPRVHASPSLQGDLDAGDTSATDDPDHEDWWKR